MQRRINKRVFKPQLGGYLSMATLMLLTVVGILALLISLLCIHHNRWNHKSESLSANVASSYVGWDVFENAIQFKQLQLAERIELEITHLANQQILKTELVAQGGYRFYSLADGQYQWRAQSTIRQKSYLKKKHLIQETGHFTIRDGHLYTPLTVAASL